MKRFIKLKEWGVSVNALMRPPDSYLENTDGSLRSEDFLLRTDENGFIRTGHHVPADAERIVILGDSVPENLYVHEGKRAWPLLERLFFTNNKLVGILNGGMSGATMLHTINCFINKVVPLNPKAVVVMNGISDIEAGLMKDGYWSEDHYVTPITRQTDVACPRTQQLRLEQREKFLQIFHHMAAVHGVPVVFTTVAHRADPDEPFIRQMYGDISEFQRKVEYRRLMNAQTREYCRKNSLNLVDLENDLRSEGNIFYDEYHLNEAGSAVVALQLYKRLSSCLIF
ncbi:SGNH/GDSL hydrolase family protein [Azohydromonas lata]|uniref:SGNH/GDSL hydrolase family protein n=1 Tax=Azohydromonas lata TaxID=45677 RepID=A0ABU5INY4_9BURK|nr:SGNH/GDSL hydrolase family protein [Azohydromonas lata]MDZ5460616.1 SGNH/GDSL hydrolase family protein [Azohydromonas lata]